MGTSIMPEKNMTAERLQSLYELIGRMNSVYDLQELLEFVVDRALSLTGGQRGLLLLSDDHERNLQHIAVIQGDTLGDKDMEHTLEFVSTTVIKDVLDRGEPRLVADLRADRRYEGVTSHTTLTIKNVRSVLAVPLKIATELVGLIYIDHPNQSIFSHNDLDFLSAFANQSALAINRAQQHQRQIDEMTLLNELSRSVVQVLDLEEVLTRIAQEAIRMLKVESSSVLLLDEETDELTFSTVVSNGQRVRIDTRLKRDQGIAGWVMTHGEPACISDVSTDPRWFGEVETGFATNSLLCIPLQLDGRVLGVLEALNKKSPSGFDSEDVAKLSAFAASATIAIENARLFQEAKQARQLRVLNEVALSLSSTLDLDIILNTSLEKSLAVLGADIGAIGLINDDAQTDLFSVQVNQGLGSSPTLAETQTEAISELSRLVLEQAMEDVLIIDKNHIPRHQAGIRLLKSGIQGLALAPIKAGEGINGALVIMHTTPHTYSQEEIDLLTGLARIIGLTAQNATQYDRINDQTQRLAYLSDIGSALTRSLDLDTVLKIIIEGVNVTLETERTSVFLIDPETDELVLRYSNEHNTDIRLPKPWQGIAGWVAENDQPALANDTLSDPRHFHELAKSTGYEAQSILCVPLKAGNQVIGVVEVLNKTGEQQFTHYHQILLMELTHWAAISIQNARLFDERVKAYERLNTEQQRRVAAETRAAMAAVILDMAHTMNNVVGAIRVWATNLEADTRVRPQAHLSDYKKEVRRIRANADEAIKLISTITDPLRKATIAPTDLHACLNDAIESCWWPDNVTLRKSFNERVPLVKANAERLEAAFHNLLSNSIQALNQVGGEIQVSTIYTVHNLIEISISDNGPGIPPELQEAIFNPGVSSKTEGLGIGLWLVETFIHQFDGRIDFTSSPETGTKFIITLHPMTESDQDTETYL
ncbi:MAG: GAF domain-containing protein [Chloroflexota bacterium]